MLNEPIITLTGNLTNDPEMRYTATGVPVATLTVASNPRVRNADGGYEDGTTVFLRVVCWRDLAENVCQSLRRGDPVMVAGKFRQREWETREGEKRRTDEIQADTVAVPLDRRIVKLTKVTREQPEPASADSTAAGSDPWAASPDGSQSAGDSMPAGEPVPARANPAESAPGPRAGSQATGPQAKGRARTAAK